MKKIIVTANSSWYLYNFRASTIRQLVLEGYLVIALAPDNNYKVQLEALGAEFLVVNMRPKSKNLFVEFISIFSHFRIFDKIKPDVILTFTPKSNIYSSLAGIFTKVKVINNISGLGGVFIKPSILNTMVTFLYRVSLNRSFHVFFQNEDDRALLIEKKCVSYDKTSRVFGSGVDLNRFKPSQNKLDSNKLKFILVARLLYTKGVFHYIRAAEILKLKYSNVEFSILGAIDPHEKLITSDLIYNWHDKGIIQYLGVTDEVELILPDYDAIVLPSFYREGVPRALIEGASCGLPIITTDNVGCRDMVNDGVNGFICEPDNLDSLVSSIDKFIRLSELERKALSFNSRQFAEMNCSEKSIIDAYLYQIRLACTGHQ
ncbi:glycosyltransferase family 4 protein [Hafnia paralvei]|uniref:glycosyltransferase family 4 protein n=1 Tax=Hafnia paralvei TaxID=546367 RepID=UPI001D0E7B90|nr:glycosyltransferase family 4 protein [Hafnia paralvei]MCE9949837.1 glycosyltransferase family 4 protein [Hafnia paralvei]